MDKVGFDTVICCDFSENVSNINTISETNKKCGKKRKRPASGRLGSVIAAIWVVMGKKHFFV